MDKTINFQLENVSVTYRTTNPTKGLIFERHCHAEFEIMLILSGNITAVIENCIYDVPAGAMLVLPPFTYHSVYANESGNYERIILNFPTERIPAVLQKELTERATHCPLVADNQQHFCKVFQKIATAEKRAYYHPLFWAELVSLTYYLCLENNCALQNKRPDDDLCGKIVDYVNANLENDITLTSIAKDLFISQSTMCHLFKDRMKISVKQYVLQKKISFATALLESGVPAGEVAKRIGYQNYANFYTLYKKFTGKAPCNAKK